jgi:hypothetical protein
LRITASHQRLAARCTLKLDVRKFLTLNVESHFEVTLKPKARLRTLQCPQPRLRRFAGSSFSDREMNQHLAALSGCLISELLNQ